jgi:hypothetical protein
MRPARMPKHWSGNMPGFTENKNIRIGEESRAVDYEHHLMRAIYDDGMLAA